MQAPLSFAIDNDQVELRTREALTRAGLHGRGHAHGAARPMATRPTGPTPGSPAAGPCAGDLVGPRLGRCLAHESAPRGIHHIEGGA